MATFTAAEVRAKADSMKLDAEQDIEDHRDIWQMLDAFAARLEQDAALTSSSYFGGYRPDSPHPCMASTGTEGRCELCGEGNDALFHRKWNEARDLWLRAQAAVTQPA